MIDSKIVDALRKRYNKIHPLIFQRSLERSKTGGELFDILDTFPDQYPVVWDGKEKRWVVTNDLFQSKSFEEQIERED